MKSIGLLFAATCLFWAVTAYPLRLVWGEESLLFGAVAAALCLAPMTATFFWVRRSEGAAPEQQLLAVLGGTALRLLVVVAGGMALFHLVPAFHYQRFWLLVIVYYLFTLTLEVVLVARWPAAPPREN
jgi:hypothetical protein